jgi:hypothetical protein
VIAVPLSINSTMFYLEVKPRKHEKCLFIVATEIGCKYLFVDSRYGRNRSDCVTVAWLFKRAVLGVVDLFVVPLPFYFVVYTYH